MSIERLRYEAQPERLPPHNIVAEESILGSVLLDAGVVDRVRPLVESRDFYRDRHGLIYEAMLGLRDREEPVDYLTLLDELDRTRRLDEAGGPSFLAGLLTAVPTPIHAEHYAKIVADAALHRRLMSAGGAIATIGFQNQFDVETALAKCEQLLLEVAKRAVPGGLRPQIEMQQAMLEQLAAANDPDRRSAVAAGVLPTMFRDLDKVLTGGFRRGELVLLGARPSMGKSSLLLGLVTRGALEYKLRVAYFTLEMADTALGVRQHAADAKVPLVRLREGGMTPAQERALGAALGRLAEVDIWWDQEPTQTVASIRSKVRRLAMDGPVDMVVIDHVQHLDGPEREMRARMTTISKGLQSLARSLGVVVLAACQLNRNVDERSDRKPQLADLAETGAWERDADVILLLTREEQWKKDTEKAGLADLQVAKNRDGGTAELTLVWEARTASFTGMETYDQLRP